ncbi:hypothetical protein QE152_g4812 [Popillia japonica]|uniref:Uncharacterized protein n=1 Tax=Popillia japonica TaxID=7064 RepID=A0AAW1N011_POPJA
MSEEGYSTDEQQKRKRDAEQIFEKTRTPVKMSSKDKLEEKIDLLISNLADISAEMKRMNNEQSELISEMKKLREEQKDYRDEAQALRRE